MEFFTTSTRNLLKYAECGITLRYPWIAVGAPLNGTVEVARPQRFRFHELIRQGLAARNDRREVVIDPHARYFGAELGERSLIPAADARLGGIRFEEWLHQPVLER
jgi:hypothetical protein